MIEASHPRKGSKKRTHNRAGHGVPGKLKTMTDTSTDPARDGRKGAIAIGIALGFLAVLILVGLYRSITSDDNGAWTELEPITSPYDGETTAALRIQVGERGELYTPIKIEVTVESCDFGERARVYDNLSAETINQRYAIDAIELVESFNTSGLYVVNDYTFDGNVMVVDLRLNNEAIDEVEDEDPHAHWSSGIAGLTLVSITSYDGCVDTT